MNQKFILDASALLALLQEEPGGHVVEKILPHAIMSSVNLSEVISVLIRAGGLSSQEAEEITLSLIKEIIPFCANQAKLAAELIQETQKYGLSFGDRACLALAKKYAFHATVFTADKAWNKLTIPSLKIQFIR